MVVCKMRVPPLQAMKIVIHYKSISKLVLHSSRRAAMQRTALALKAAAAVVGRQWHILPAQERQYLNVQINERRVTIGVHFREGPLLVEDN